jgi:hypothetical protein
LFNVSGTKVISTSIDPYFSSRSPGMRERRKVKSWIWAI